MRRERCDDPWLWSQSRSYGLSSARKHVHWLQEESRPSTALRDWLRHRRALAVSLVGIVLGLASLFGPWWVTSYRTTDGLPRTAGWGVFGATYTGPSSPGTSATTWTSDYRNRSAIGSIFGIAGALLGLGIVSATAMTVSLVRTEPECESEELKGALGVLSSGLILSALLYLMVALPRTSGLPFVGSDQVGFWGTICSATCDTGVTLGAGWAWYTALAASVILFGGGVVLWNDLAYARDWHWLTWLSRNGLALMVVFGVPAILFTLWSTTTIVAEVAGALAFASFLAACLVRPARIIWKCRTCGAVFYGADRIAVGEPHRSSREFRVDAFPVGAFYAFASQRRRCPACQSTHFRSASHAEVASARAAHEVYGDAPWRLKPR